jgi:hypothetical protein
MAFSFVVGWGDYNSRMDKDASDSLRSRFMQAPLASRLDHLAATLARISTSARHTPDPAPIVHLLEQASLFIECTAPETPPALAAELTQMNVILGMWKKSWPRARKIPQQRTLLAAQTKNWSDTILKFSRMC